MSYADRRKGKLTGRWVGEVDVKQGGLELRFRRRFETKGEADGYEAYVKATGQEPPGMQENPVGSFDHWARLFLERNPEWGRKDRSALQRLQWVRDRKGMLDVKAFTTSVMDGLVTELRKKGLSNRTINRYLDAASKPLGFAHERGALTGMPHVPRLADTGNDRTEVLSFDLEDAVCEWIETHRDPRIAFVIRVYAETGMRASELHKLEPGQVGDEAITLRRDQTKTDAARVVPVPADMASKLRAMIAAGAVPKAGNVYKVFKAAVEAVGGSAELTIHSLRHTRATRLIVSGVDTLTTAAMLGHSSLQTTKRYTHPDPEALAEAAKKVHQARGEKVQKGSVVPFAPAQKAV